MKREILLTLVVLLSLFIAYDWFQSRPQSNGRQKYSELDPVNKHMQDVQIKLEAQEAHFQSQMQQKMDYVPPEKPADVLLSEEELFQQLNNSKNKQDASQSIGDQIQNQVFREQISEAETLAQKKALADAFIENARRGGYQVKLNEKFEIISVKPLTKRQTLPLFPEQRDSNTEVGN